MSYIGYFTKIFSVTLLEYFEYSTKKFSILIMDDRIFLTLTTVIGRRHTLVKYSIYTLLKYFHFVTWMMGCLRLQPPALVISDDHGHTLIEYKKYSTRIFWIADKEYSTILF